MTIKERVNRDHRHRLNANIEEPLFSFIPTILHNDGLSNNHLILQWIATTRLSYCMSTEDSIRKSPYNSITW